MKTIIEDENVSPASMPHFAEGKPLFFRFKKDQAFTFTDDLKVTHSGRLNWNTVLGDQSINLTYPGKYFFEVKINIITESWGMGIGVADKAFDNSGTTILGYRDLGKGKSWSWFTYKSANNEGFLHDGVVSGEKPIAYTNGDVVKVVIDASNKSIEFFKNNESLGIPWENIASDEVIPAITFCNQNDSITLIQ